MNIQENFSLKTFNTFGVEAKAKYFAEVHSLEELKETLQFSYSPILVLGGGSNVLFTKDFEGLVIKLNLKELTMIYKYAYSPSKGIIAGMTGEMLAYFKPRFHPNDLDTVQLLKDWKAKLGF